MNNISVIRTAPCKDCSDRDPKAICHSTCERYKKYRALVDEANKHIRQIKHAKIDFRDYREQAVNNMRTKQKKH